MLSVLFLFLNDCGQCPNPICKWKLPNKVVTEEKGYEREGRGLHRAGDGGIGGDLVGYVVVELTSWWRDISLKANKHRKNFVYNVDILT